jgi:hypothetical protein
MDSREPGRWGPRGTHVLQAPERVLGAATLESHDEVVELSTGRIACTSVQKKKKNKSTLVADQFVVLPIVESWSDDL